VSVRGEARALRSHASTAPSRQQTSDRAVAHVERPGSDGPRQSRLSVKIVIAGDCVRSLSEEVISMASCNCQCAWCKEARANKYSTHSCSQIPKCSGSK